MGISASATNPQWPGSTGHCIAAWLLQRPILVSVHPVNETIFLYPTIVSWHSSSLSSREVWPCQMWLYRSLVSASLTAKIKYTILWLAIFNSLDLSLPYLSNATLGTSLAFQMSLLQRYEHFDLRKKLDLHCLFDTLYKSDFSFFLIFLWWKTKLHCGA